MQKCNRKKQNYTLLKKISEMNIVLYSLKTLHGDTHISVNYLPVLLAEINIISWEKY